MDALPVLLVMFDLATARLATNRTSGVRAVSPNKAFYASPAL